MPPVHLLRATQCPVLAQAACLPGNRLVRPRLALTRLCLTPALGLAQGC